MTTPLYPSPIDEQLEEVAGHSPAEVIECAARIGLIGWPVKAYREPNGLWIHRYSSVANVAAQDAMEAMA